MSLLARLWAHRRERPVFVALSIGVLGFFLTYPAVDWWLRSIDVAGPYRFWDFGAYTGAVDRWLDGGEVYQRGENGGFHGTFLYPPVVLLLFAPFHAFPSVVSISGIPPLVSLLGLALFGSTVNLGVFQLSALAWLTSSVLLLWIGLQLAIDELSPGLSIPERGLLLWAILGFQPLLLSIKLGQTAAFLTGMLCFSLAALVRAERANQFVSGAFTSVVGIIKLTYATAGAHLLASRDRFLGALATGVLLVGTSLLVFGIEIHLTYIDVLAWGFERGSDARSPALWQAPYYRPLFWLPASVVIRVTAAGLIALGVVLSPASGRRETFALGVAAIPLLSPLTYAYYFVPLLAAFVALLAVELDRDGYPILPVLALLVVSIHSFGLRFVVESLSESTLQAFLPFVQPKVGYALLQPGLWGNLLFVGLAAYRVAERIVSE